MVTRLAIESLRLSAALLHKRELSPDEISSVALIELTGLGDVIATLPVISGLKKLFPSAEIHLVVDRRFAPLLDSCQLPLAVHGISQPRSAAGTVGAIRLLRRLRPSIACSMSPPRKNAMVALASGARSIAGYLRYTDTLAPYLLKTPVEAFGLSHEADVVFGRDHISERAAKICHALGLHSDFEEPSIHLTPSVVDHVRSLLSGTGLLPESEFVVIHPFAGWRYRQWPEERFADLASHLVEREGKAVVFLWEGQRDENLFSLRQRFAKNSCVTFAPGLQLMESAVMISSASLFIGNDSGPLHLAAALKVPVIGLFGPADPMLTAPRTAAPSVWLYKKADCSPCDQRRCVMPNGPCMATISIKEVVAAASEVRRRAVHA